MISVEEARQLLQQEYKKNKTALVSLREANGMVLSSAVKSLVDVPPFTNSAVDGYAFRMADWQPEKPLTLEGESAAGLAGDTDLLPTESAVRIFTGAMVPAGADTVVMQEKVEAEDGKIIIKDERILPGANVRLQGSQTKAGDSVLSDGHQLNPAGVAFLAGLGITQVEVYSKPRMHVIITGNEIVPPGEILLPGQVYECNSYGLVAALAALNIIPEVKYCRDNMDDMSKVVSTSLGTSDILLITGGVSVGDYDFVIPALEKNGVQKIFHRVKQKPAKPLYFGKKENVFVFGLPGNPASVLTSYYAYVRPFIQYGMGINEQEEVQMANLLTEHSSKAGLTRFLKGYLEQGNVSITPGQESYRMDGFALSNCLIEISAEVEFVAAHSPVKVIPF